MLPLVEWNWRKVMVACGADCVPSVQSRVWRETDIIRYARVRPASAEGIAIAEAFAAKATKVLVIEDSKSPRTWRPTTASSHRAANAIKPFLRDHPCFVVDRRPEYYYITQHWGGYLYKRRAASGCADESNVAAAAASTPAQSRRRRRPG